MTNKLRKQAAAMLREKLDGGIHRKLAMREVIEWVKSKNPRLPCSRASIYNWCARFGIPTD